MIPHYLYHYTSAESLIKILDSRKIRFTRLDLLNDPYEGYVEIADVSGTDKNCAKLIYCSCWNESSEEDIALWYVYTKVSGVRIKMKSAMFGKNMSLEENISGYYPVVNISDIDIGVDIPIKTVRGPIKIQYETELRNIYERAVRKSIANIGTENEFVMNELNLNEIGVRKTKHWSYENEWRYKISPFTQIHGSNNVINKQIPYNLPEYVDVPFIVGIEEILLAPQILQSDVEKIEKYLMDNKIDILIKRSCIKTRFGEG